MDMIKEKTSLLNSLINDESVFHKNMGEWKNDHLIARWLS